MNEAVTISLVCLIVFKYFKFKIDSKRIHRDGFRSGYEQGLRHGGVAFDKLSKIEDPNWLQYFVTLKVNYPPHVN